MEKIKVRLQPDHLQRLSGKRSLITSLSELIWNGLDADASTVSIKFQDNGLGDFEAIHVCDNGHGFNLTTAKTSFANLGSSWKKTQRTTASGRKLHGSAGEGRFAAFAIGKHIVWRSYYFEGDVLRGLEIWSDSDLLGEFQIKEIAVPSTVKSPGTEVIITNLHEPASRLWTESSRSRLAESFALYLRGYKAEIIHDDQLVDPRDVEDLYREYPIPADVSHGVEASKLCVIEWKCKVDRNLYLCDGGGFPLAAISPNIHAPGFQFTAYLENPMLKDLHASGQLDLAELNPAIAWMIDSAKSILKDHFRKRLEERAASLVAEWKSAEVYPFASEAASPVEQMERKVFDVVAYCVNEYLPHFPSLDAATKKFSFKMLRTAIERSPVETRKIIQEVLALPKEKQEELAQLLEKTKLSSVISASKIIADRLEFITGLEVILFQSDIKEKVKERQHLHRLLAENTWIFGEEFNLSVDDQSLNEVLKKHLGLLDKKRTDLAPVTSLEGDACIVDLMLSRSIPQQKPAEREHLIIELKRPAVKIGNDETGQIEKYAFAVAEDERFRDVNTRWVFWVVSNDMDKHVRAKVTKQSDRADGLLYLSPNVTIWVKSWGQVLESARARLRFFEEKLNYIATHDSGLQYLQRTHAKYLPKNI